MRRWFAKFLPIFAIAIWAQLVAPLVPYMAAAAVASDPLAAAEICTETSNSGSHDPAGPSGSQHACLLQCCLSHVSTVAFDGPQTIVAEIVRPWARIVWFDDARQTPPRHAFSNTQARAPPVFS